MTDRSIARATGVFGLACVVLSWAQFPLWVIGGAPSFYDRDALARHLYDIRATAFIPHPHGSRDLRQHDDLYRRFSPFGATGAARE